MIVRELFEHKIEEDENIYDALKHLFKDKSASAKNLDEFAKYALNGYKNITYDGVVWKLDLHANYTITFDDNTLSLMYNSRKGPGSINIKIHLFEKNGKMDIYKIEHQDYDESKHSFDLKTHIKDADEHVRRTLGISELNKDSILRSILGKYKIDGHHTALKNIDVAAAHGYDYPEFNVIRKSAEHSEKDDILGPLEEILQQKQSNYKLIILSRITRFKNRGLEYPEFDGIVDRVIKTFSKPELERFMSKLETKLKDPALAAGILKLIKQRLKSR